MPEKYRWNVPDVAAGYDAAAELIHPYYREVQDTILALLPFPADADVLVVDAGGGSGRLVERFLGRFSRAQAIVLDQSEAFLARAKQRLKPFGPRSRCHMFRLQEDWPNVLPARPAAVVTTSAVHHLDAEEKKVFYERCFTALHPEGVLLNGDEIKDADDRVYLAQCQAWAAHMQKVMDAGLVPEPMCEALRQWKRRNVLQFDTPRVSGDDCHETIQAQVEYLVACGFRSVDVPWHRDMWAVLHAVK